MDKGVTNQVRETGWSKSTNNLSSNIEQLRNRVECLIGRIEPILAPSAPTNAKSPTEPSMPKAKVISQLDDYAERINDLRILIDEIISRIEI